MVNQKDQAKLSLEDTRKRLQEENIKIKERKVFNPDYMPENILYRNVENNELTTIIQRFIKGGGIDQAHLVGPNSTGKTLLTKWWARVIEEGIEPEINYVHVTCKNSDWQNILEEIGEELDVDGTHRGVSKQKAFKRIFQKIKDGKTVIVLDEFDKLSENSRSTLVSALSRPRELAGFSPDILTLICTNQPSAVSELDNDREDQTHTAAWNNKKIRFRSYKKKQLEEIFLQRFEKGLSEDVYTEEMIEYLAELVEEYMQGDIRAGLHAIQDAIDELVKKDKDQLDQEIINSAVVNRIRDRIETELEELQNMRTVKVLLASTCCNSHRTTHQTHKKYDKMYDDKPSLNTIRNHLNKLEEENILERENVGRNQYQYLLREGYRRRETAQVCARLIARNTDDVFSDFYEEYFDTKESEEAKALNESEELLGEITE